MGLFGNLLKKRKTGQDTDLSQKFGANVVDEIERLNQEFKSQSALSGGSEPELPPEPEAVQEDAQLEMEAPETAPQEEEAAPEIEVPQPEEEATLSEPPEMEEEKPAKKVSVAKKKSSSKKSKQPDFSSKIEKIKKRLESSEEAKAMQKETSKKLDTIKTDFNKKVNTLIDEVREVNKAFAQIEEQGEILAATQKKTEELEAQVDDLGVRMRDLDKVETLRKDLLAVKKSVRDASANNSELESVRELAQDNAEKLKQLLALVEMLTER